MKEAVDDAKLKAVIDAVSKEDLVFGLAGDGIRNQAQAISEYPCVNLS